MEPRRTRSLAKLEEEKKGNQSDEDDEEEGDDEEERDYLTPIVDHYQLDTVGSYDMIIKFQIQKITRFRFNIP